MPSKFGAAFNKFNASPSKFHGSWRSPVEQEEPVVKKEEEERVGAWTKQEMDSGRPGDWVGGYDPEYCRNYRRQMAARKKQIDLYK